jgi:hypothetical protein
MNVTIENFLSHLVLNVNRGVRLRDGGASRADMVLDLREVLTLEVEGFLEGWGTLAPSTPILLLAIDHTTWVGTYSHPNVQWLDGQASEKTFLVQVLPNFLILWLNGHAPRRMSKTELTGMLILVRLYNWIVGRYQSDLGSGTKYHSHGLEAARERTPNGEDDPFDLTLSDPDPKFAHRPITCLPIDYVKTYGLPLMALCGRRYVPLPERPPTICPECDAFALAPKAREAAIASGLNRVLRARDLVQHATGSLLVADLYAIRGRIRLKAAEGDVALRESASQDLWVAAVMATGLVGEEGYLGPVCAVSGILEWAVTRGGILDFGALADWLAQGVRHVPDSFAPAILVTLARVEGLILGRYDTALQRLNEVERLGSHTEQYVAVEALRLGAAIVVERGLRHYPDCDAMAALQEAKALFDRSGLPAGDPRRARAVQKFAALCAGRGDWGLSERLFEWAIELASLDAPVNSDIVLECSAALLRVRIQRSEG